MALDRNEMYTQIEEFGSTHQMLCHEQMDRIFDLAGMTADKKQVIWIVRDGRTEHSPTYHWKGNWCVMEKVDRFFHEYGIRREDVTKHYQVEKLGNIEFWVLGPIQLLEGETFDNIREKLSHIYAPLQEHMAEPV